MFDLASSNSSWNSFALFSSMSFPIMSAGVLSRMAYHARNAAPAGGRFWASTAATGSGSSHRLLTEMERRHVVFHNFSRLYRFRQIATVTSNKRTAMNSPKPKQNNLVLYRRRMGFTQKQVARSLGHRDTSMISHYEHGRALPPLAGGLEPRDHLRVPVAFLFPALYDELKQGIRQQRGIRRRCRSTAFVLKH